MMSQESQPSSSISARVIGKKGAMPKRLAQCLRYEKRGFGTPTGASVLEEFIEGAFYSDCECVKHGKYRDFRLWECGQR